MANNNPKRYTIEDAMRAEKVAPPPPPPQPMMQYYGYPYYQQQPYPMAPFYQYQNLYSTQPPQVVIQTKVQPIQQVYQQQPVQQQIQQIQKPDQFLPPIDESELDQPSRWDQEIKIYAHLFRKLNIQVPNLASARYCNNTEVFIEQTLAIVKNYVERSFNKCQTDEERNMMDQFLKNTIAEAKRKNEYYTRDWNKFPLPTLPRENQIRQSSIGTSLNLNARTKETLQNLSMSNNKFGAPSAPLPAVSVKPSASLETVQSLYDRMRQQQVDTINLNYQKKPLDFFMQQAKQMQPTQIKEQQKIFKKQIKEDLKMVMWSKKIIGTCEDLEKQYLRLTGLPDPNMIRPEPTLKKSLAHILQRWRNNEIEYDYVIEQFRSIRQDLLVQHIENHFTVQVYEENARICLECGDFARYESCWTMLCELYEMISISESKNPNQIGNKVEFDSYRIVYLTMLNKQEQLVKILHQIQPDERISLALEYLQLIIKTPILIFTSIREYYKCGNYVKLFQKQKTAPSTMSSVIKHFLVRIRVKALRQTVKSSIGSLELKYLSELLAFEDLETFRQFIQYFEQCRFDETLQYLLVQPSYNAFDNINFDKPQG